MKRITLAKYVNMNWTKSRRFFQLKEIKKEENADDNETSSKAAGENEDLTKVPKELELDDMLEKKEDDEDGEHPKLSKRKLKKLSRLSVAELKQLVTRPGKKS